MTLLGAILVGWIPLSANADPMPSKMQAVMFKKILLFDRTLQNDVRMAIVYSDEAGAADEMKSAFEGIGIKSSVHKVADPNSLSAYNAVYVFAKAASPGLKDASVKHKFITLSGNVNLAEAGDAAVAVDMKDGKPNIVVNHNQAKRQGHDLASELLRLATVVN